MEHYVWLQNIISQNMHSAYIALDFLYRGSVRF